MDAHTDPTDADPTGADPTDARPTSRWITHSEFERIYGPQVPLTPEEARDLFAGLEVPWWVAGGWAIEAFTGVPRDHEDIDLSAFRRDERAVRRHLERHFHVWSASDQGLLHLTPDRDLPDHSGQLWFREHALAPWRGEVLLNGDVDGRWQSKRDPTLVAPLSDVTWERDGIRYLRPEIVLTHKVATARAKDDVDFDAALPLLDDRGRALLTDFLARHAPAHPWRARLEA